MLVRLLHGLLPFVASLAGWVVAAPIALAVLPFWVIAQLTRHLARALEPRKLEWPECFDFIPEIGWKLRPHLRVYAEDLNGDAFRVTTDESGWRGRYTVAESDVLVVGDSFAFGYGIDDDQFFAHLCRGLKVKGMGAPGYSMVQPVLWMRRLSDQLAGKLVVWLVYLGNDLDDSIAPNQFGYRSPFVRLLDKTGSCEIVTSHVRPDRWTLQSRQNNSMAYVQICSPTHFSDRVFTACEYLVMEARDICRAAGAELVIATVPELSPIQLEQLEKALAESRAPELFDPEKPDRRFAEICERLDVTFVALKDHLGARDYLENDAHWNARGHRRVAEVIEGLHSGRIPARRHQRAVPQDVGDVLTVASGEA